MSLSSYITNDTIVAPSTVRGYSGIAVIRMSGPDALSILKKVFLPRKAGVRFKNRRVVYGVIWDAARNRTLDDGMALFLKGPSTYTGEDLVEISLHGSPVVTDMVMGLIVENGARPADPGEFTRRSFLAGKLDLIQTEAVIDLIEADAPIAAEEARARLSGVPSQEIKALSDSIKDVLAELEAYIDFDEDEEGPAPDPFPALTKIAEDIELLRESSGIARIQREGIVAIITGKPNVGKSTLFNALLGIDRAIVTAYPGTTRDTVEDRLLIKGNSLLLCDTAGIRNRPDPVEAEGIRRAREKIQESDIVIAVMDGSESLDDEDLLTLKTVADRDAIIVINKADLGTTFQSEDIPFATVDTPRLVVSAHTGQGLAELKNALAKSGKKQTEHLRIGAKAGLNNRGLLLLNEADNPIQGLLSAKARGEIITPEIVSFELRRSLASIREITGEKVDQGVLDRIFERFCVGK